MATLAEIIKKHGGLIQTGPFGSQLKQAEYVEDGVPVVMPKDIINGSVCIDTVARVTEQKADQLSRHKMQARTIVFPRRGEISKCAYISEEQQGFLCGTGCLKIEVPRTVIEPKFLYYYLGLRHVVEWLQRNAVGTTMLNLNTSILGGVEFPDISLEKQQEIASVIDTYERMLENNRRRIQLLEESARLLYREWFIHLRFPGHEHVKVVDGVPEGWGKTTINEVAETIGGGTPSTKVDEYWNDGDVTWFVPRDLTNNDSLVLLDSEKKITELGLKKSSAKILPPETILMTSRASIGFFGLYESEACTNQGFISVVPKLPISKMYLLHNLMWRVEEIRGLAGGTTFKEINKTTFRAMDIVLPEEGVRNEFEEFAYDIIRQVRIITKQTKKLEEARDLLLPRLMNGDIAV